MVNNKESFIGNMKLDIQRIQSAIIQAESLEQGKIYEFKYYNDRILGIVRGFSYGLMSSGVRIEILGTDTQWRGHKSMTLSLYSDLNIKFVSYTDFPKYLGWGEGLRNSFVKRLKNIDKYIKREEKATKGTTPTPPIIK